MACLLHQHKQSSTMGFIEDLINSFYSQCISRKCISFGPLCGGLCSVHVKLKVMKKISG